MGQAGGRINHGGELLYGVQQQRLQPFRISRPHMGEANGLEQIRRRANLALEALVQESGRGAFAQRDAKGKFQRAARAPTA